MKTKTNDNAISRYVHLSAGTIALLFLGVVYAWSIFKSPIKELIPSITDKELSLTFTISIIFFCIGGLLGGFLASKIKTRYRIIIASIMVFTGLTLMSGLSADSSNPAMKMYLYYGVISGMGVGFAYNSLISGVIVHFQDQVGMASGTLMLGFGFGGIILGSIASYFESTVGISTTFFIIGCMFLPPLIFAAYALGKESKDDGKNAAALEQNGDEKNYTPKEMLKTPFFLWFVLWNILVCSCGLMIISSASQISQSFGAPAIVGLLVSVSNGGGRILVGKIFDIKGEKAAIYTPNIFLIISGISLLIGFMTSNMILGIIGLLACGVSYGCSPALASAIIKNTYGSEHYPSNFSIINFQLVIAATVGPTLSHYLREQSGGSFKLSYVSIIVFAAAALAVTILMIKSKKKIV